MVSQIPQSLDEIKEEVLHTFGHALSRLGTCEKSLDTLLDKEKLKIIELDRKIADLKHEEDTIKSLRSELDKKMITAKGISIQAEKDRQESEALMEKARQELDTLNKSKEALVQETKSLKELEKELNKRQAMLEMGERRLKFLDHKLSLLASDKEISAKLKELE